MAKTVKIFQKSEMSTDIFITTLILNQHYCSWAYFKGKIYVNNFTISDFYNIKPVMDQFLQGPILGLPWNT